MSFTRSELLLLAVSPFLVAIAVHRTRSETIGRIATPVVIAPERMPTAADSTTIEEAVSAIIDSDPFRLSNMPARVRYQAANAVAPSALPVPRPTLVLRAIVGGPPWSAVLDGLPGQSMNTVVGEGAVFGTLRIRRITRDEVVVLASDTTLRLSLNRGIP